MSVNVAKGIQTSQGSGSEIVVYATGIADDFKQAREVCDGGAGHAESSQSKLKLTRR